ncbi:MAG: hypothetical protein MJ051_00150 [Akkermansia sp.]|nr:hypothetical protein [Akkermansia sp.]
MQETSGTSSPIIVKGRAPITCSRFVAFLDILGFKDRVARSTHAQVLNTLQGLQKKISESMESHKEEGLQISLFSDSIVIFSKNDSRKSLISLSNVTLDIMRYAIGEKIPMKGAIAKGKITCDTTKQLFFGQALIDAFQLQESTKYYGVVVHHSAEEDAKDLPIYFQDTEAYIEGSRIHHYELLWHRFDCIPQKEIQNSLSLLRNSVSGEPRKYIDNTMKIIKNGTN